MFHIFSSQEERRKFGASAFIEIQFCKMPAGTKAKKAVSLKNITYWQIDSLYIYANDIEDFIKEYGHIIDCGIYHDLKSGALDIFGLNYYKPDSLESIISKLLEYKPTDYEILLEWLNKAKDYNGFYILGI